MTPETIKSLEVCFTLAITLSLLCPILVYCLPNRQANRQTV